MARVFDHVLLIGEDHELAQLQDVRGLLAEHAVEGHSLYVEPVLVVDMVDGYRRGRAVIERVPIPLPKPTSIVNGSGVAE